jgi:hypothetical protein
MAHSRHLGEGRDLSPPWDTGLRRHDEMSGAAIKARLDDGWAWLDVLIGRLDDDSVTAVNERPA